MQHDLVIKNGAVITATNTFVADVAIQGEQIAAIGDVGANFRACCTGWLAHA